MPYFLLDDVLGFLCQLHRLLATSWDLYTVGGEELTIAFSCKCASSGMFMGNSMVNKCHLMT